MKGSLEYEDGKIVRSGPVNLLYSGGYLVIVNPSEVLAHEDELTVKIQGKKMRITDQAYTKILKMSDVKVTINIDGDEVDYFPHPVIFYNLSRARIHTRINVRKRGRVVEAFILGRTGSMEEFTEGDALAVTEVYFKDRLLIYDVFRGDKSYKSKNIMGKEALLAVYEIENGEYKFDKVITDYKNLDKLWREVTKIHF